MVLVDCSIARVVCFETILLSLLPPQRLLLGFPLLEPLRGQVKLTRLQQLGSKRLLVASSEGVPVQPQRGEASHVRDART